MGREIKRVPLDFNFPLEDSYSQTKMAEHQETCTNLDDEGECQCDYSCYAEPPKGIGWQLWQTVSDGPISPVFETADELIDWMCQPVPFSKRPHYEPAAYPKMPWAQGWRREVAEPFVRDEGWAPSAVMLNGVWMSGVEAHSKCK